MTLRDLLSPAFACFILVLGVSIFVNVPNNALAQIITPSPSVVVSLPESTPLVTTPTVTPSLIATTPKVTKAPIATPKPTSKPSVASCIVTINGHKYDVIRLRSTHSGGDVFTCNTDMTRIFNSQHGNNYGLIARYLIN